MLFDKPLREHPPLLQLILIFSLCIASGGLFTLLALQLAETVTGIPGQLVPFWLENPEARFIPYIWWMQSMSAVGLLVVPGLVWSYYYDYNTPWEPLGLQHPTKFKVYAATAVLMLIILPLVYAIYAFNQSMALPEAWSELEKSLQNAEATSQQTITLLLSATGWTGFVFNLIVIALLPALSEELIFRGVLQNIVRNSSGNPHLAIWLAAFVFSAVHMQWYGFLPRMLLGALFGYLYFWSGQLSLAVLAHFVNNAIAVLFEYAAKTGQAPVTETELLQSPWWLVLLSALFTGILLRYLHLHRLKLNPQIPSN